MITVAPAKNDMGFKAWLNKGIVKLLDVYENPNLMSFTELKAKFDIPQKHFLSTGFYLEALFWRT